MAQHQMNSFFFVCYTVVVFRTRRRLLSDKLHRGWSSVRVVIFRTEQNLHSVTAAAVVNVIDHTKDVQILPLLFSIPECSIFWLFNLFLKVKSQLRIGKNPIFLDDLLDSWCNVSIQSIHFRWNDHNGFIFICWSQTMTLTHVRVLTSPGHLQAL